MARSGTVLATSARVVPSEKARIAAVIVSQAIIAVAIFGNYFLLYGLERNRLLDGIVAGGLLSIVVGLVYVDLIYDLLTFFDPDRTKPIRSADSLLRIYSAINLVGLFFLVRFSIAPDVYAPVFLTLPTVAIILGTPAWWTRGLILTVGITYGATLYLPKLPVPNTGRAHQDAAHGVTLVLCLIVIFAEHLIVQRHQKKEPQIGARP